eukprot:EG_transcript_6714
MARILCEEAIPWSDVTQHFEWAPEANKIGEGTFGSVCRARCVHARPTGGMVAGDWYAVKVLRKAELREEADWLAVLHEVLVLQQLAAAPYCARLFDAFQSETAVYLVLEYVDGQDLFDHICSHGHLHEAEAVNVARQLLAVVHDLHHARRVVHRDLKPENVLLVKGTNHVKLIDFGCAKGLPQLGCADHQLYNCLSPEAAVPSADFDVVFNTPMGTMTFCAPELLREVASQGETAYHSTWSAIQKLDVYAIGAVVYMMLSGEAPFRPKCPRDLAVEMEGGPKFPVKLFRHASTEAKQFCAWAMAADPSRRPTAWEALQHPWLQPSPAEGRKAPPVSLAKGPADVHVAAPAPTPRDLPEGAGLRRSRAGTPVLQAAAADMDVPPLILAAAPHPLPSCAARPGCPFQESDAPLSTSSAA